MATSFGLNSLSLPKATSVGAVRRSGGAEGFPLRLWRSKCLTCDCKAVVCCLNCSCVSSANTPEYGTFTAGATVEGSAAGHVACQCSKATMSSRIPLAQDPIVLGIIRFLLSRFEHSPCWVRITQRIFLLHCGPRSQRRSGTFVAKIWTYISSSPMSVLVCHSCYDIGVSGL